MKTNLQVLNEISAKLEGEDNATSITEALNNIANALGDNNPDEIVSVSNSLEDILSVAGQGGLVPNPVFTVNITNSTGSEVPFDNVVALDKYQNGGFTFLIPPSTALPPINLTTKFMSEEIGSGNYSFFMEFGEDSNLTINISNEVNCTIDTDNSTYFAASPLASECSFDLEISGGN